MTPEHPFHRRVAAIAGLADILFALPLLAGGWLLHLLAPGPGEWQHPLRVGPVTVPVGIGRLLHHATDPRFLPQLDGRTFASRFGSVTLHRQDAALVADCTPCTLKLPALGPQPVVLPSLQVRVQPAVVDGLPTRPRQLPPLAGTVVAGAAGQQVQAAWQLDWQPHGHPLPPASRAVPEARLSVLLAPHPLAHLVTLFGEAVPEARHARLSGRVGLDLEARIQPPASPTPSFSATLRGADVTINRLVPKLDGIQVSGLGTEQLAGADVSAACASAAPGGRITGWLPRAVIAAEDQRFYQHPGYDLNEWLAAWNRNQADPEAKPRGASTLSQQLAKLLYTGDAPHAMRKLREWLYAVELDRTLGKARQLQLYLAVVPWGRGHCGAEAAAQAYLGKSANTLNPLEAAWLASLLNQPNTHLDQLAATGRPNLRRTRWVLANLQGLSGRERKQLVAALNRWVPPASSPVTDAAEAKRDAPQRVAGLL